MTNASKWPASIPGHVAMTIDDFMSRDMHCECSCGWVGPNVYANGVTPRLNAALATYSLHVAAYRPQENVEKLDLPGPARLAQSSELAVVGHDGSCPTCGWLYGFHDPVAHGNHKVPSHLTWLPGEEPLWKRA